MVPLDHVVLYSADSYPNKYWTEQRNTTEWNVMMKEFVAAGNELTKLMLANLAPTLKDAHVCKSQIFFWGEWIKFGQELIIFSKGLFDSHGLFTDILNNPALYLNGTAPLNTTGCWDSCVFQLNESTSGPADCTVNSGTAADSFVW